MRAAARLTTSPAAPVASTSAPVTAGRLGEPADGLPDDPAAEEDEHDRVHERGEHLRPPPAEAALRRGRPLRDPGGAEREPERERVREHVGGVREQRERPGREPCDDLDPGEAEHERQRNRERALLSAVRVHPLTVARAVPNL